MPLPYARPDFFRDPKIARVPELGVVRETRFFPGVDFSPGPELGGRPGPYFWDSVELGVV